MVYREEETTKYEKDLIKQLKQRLGSELPLRVTSKSSLDQDLYLVQWLRDQDHNLDKATEQLRKSLEWRKERRADEVLKVGVDPFILQHFPFTFPGVDKQGHPVVLLPLSEWDSRVVISKNKTAEFDDFVVYFCESVMEAIWRSHKGRKENESSVTQAFGIVDVNKYPYGQLLNYKAMKKIIQIPATIKAHYPNLLFKAAVINCPSYFGLFMNMLKQVIGSETSSKIKCYSSIKDWQKDMGNYIDPSIVPKRYGGTSPK